MDPAELQRVALFLAGWLFVLGGVFGSFMNVVVYRLPRGMSLTHPGSRCPRCRHAIRWYHNVPVLGWLVLRGRCYDCRAPISARYPLVELATACLLLGLSLVEIFSGGQNLPARIGGDGWPLYELLEIYFYHAYLACVLLCVALIEFDRQPIPSRLVIFTLAVGLIFPLFWPELRPVHFLQITDRAAEQNTWQLGLFDGACGLISGGLLVLATQWITRGRGLYLAAGWLCLGSFFGWQATLGIAALTLPPLVVVMLLERSIPRLKSWPQTAWQLAAMLVWLVVWGAVWRHFFPHPPA